MPSSGPSPQCPQGLLIYSGNGCAMKRVLWFTVPGSTVCHVPVVYAGGIERFNLTETMKTTTLSKAASAV